MALRDSGRARLRPSRRHRGSPGSSPSQDRAKAFSGPERPTRSERGYSDPAGVPDRQVSRAADYASISEINSYLPMDLRDTLTALLPPPRDDEPASLRAGHHRRAG